MSQPPKPAKGIPKGPLVHHEPRDGKRKPVPLTKQDRERLEQLRKEGNTA